MPNKRIRPVAKHTSSPEARSEIVEEKLALANRVVAQLRRKLGPGIQAVGVVGSVARGTAQKYSDIDLLLIVRRKPSNLGQLGLREAHDGNLFMIVNDTYCSLSFETWSSAVGQLTRPNLQLPELLGGFTKIHAIYDPKRVLPRLEAKAQNILPSVFRESAELALLHSYEDYCRVKNAYLSGDEIVMRDNVLYVTHSAALVVACLNHSHFRSDREIFKAHGKLPKLPRHFSRIEKLRYGNLTRRKLFQMLVAFYGDLIGFAEKEGIRFPVGMEKLREL